MEKNINFDFFERDLLRVLKNDAEHRIPFDGVLEIPSERLECTLKATNVRLDSATGELVMVGAFFKGKPVMDTGGGYPVMKTEIEIPLRECFRDLQKNGEGLRLLSKTKKAVLDKYVLKYLQKFERRGMLAEGHDLAFSNFDMDPVKSGIGVDMLSVSRTGDDYNVLCEKEEFKMAAPRKLSHLSLSEMQDLGRSLREINRSYTAAAKVFNDCKSETEGLSMSLSERDVRENNSRALVAMYERCFPMEICAAVARTLTGSDVFDISRHSLREIEDFVSRYARTVKTPESRWKRNTEQKKRKGPKI